MIVCELVSLLHKGDEGGGGEDRDALDMSDRNGTERNGRSFNPWMGGMAVGGDGVARRRLSEGLGRSMDAMLPTSLSR